MKPCNYHLSGLKDHMLRTTSDKLTSHATHNRDLLTICDSLYENAQPRAKLLISVEAKMFSIVIQA